MSDQSQQASHAHGIISLALRESEERFRMLADNMSQLAWTCDLLGNVTWYNQRWLDYTGLTFEEMKGWGWKHVQHPDHVDRVVARVEHSRDTGEPWEDTFPLRARDGTYRWFLSRALPIRDERGNLVQWFGTNTDVHEQKLAEEQVARQADELRALNVRLQELDRLKTEFFFNVSHEFRTPLTLMLGPLDELLQHSLPDAVHAELTVIGRNGRRLLKLVNTLLDFSRIEAGRLEAVYQPTDLSTLTTEIAAVFRSAIEQAGLQLLVDCPPIAEPIYVDREMWEKIVLNLLSNAFKFTIQGEITVTLRLTTTHAELRMQDTGVGIPADQVPHIFERFHRVTGTLARTHEGAGIGLALVKELAAIHGGSIRADSVEGRETIMTVSIPRGRAHLPEARIGVRRTLESTATIARAYVDEALRWAPEEAAIEHEVSTVIPAAPASGRRGRPFVLCVDDNADMRAYLHRLLSVRYEVEAVENGQAALHAVRCRVPNLVIADVMMPGIDGLELLGRLREDPQTRIVPVLLLSARAGEDSRVDGLQTGADDYLVKPFSARELLARVSAHLELARVRKDVLRRERAALVAIEASEAQRHRISRELHDELGQQLTALVLGLKNVRDAVTADSPVRGPLQRLQDMAAAVSRDMHHVALELRPGALDDKGLQTALSNYVEEWSKRNNVSAEVQFVGLRARRLPPHVENTVYRIVQEALTNVGKHAKATAVSVVLQHQGEDVLAIVEDDGQGFEVPTRSEGSGLTGRLGLMGMKERAALVGGACDVESNSDGTTVFARIPVSLDEDRRV